MKYYKKLTKIMYFLINKKKYYFINNIIKNIKKKYIFY